MKKFLLLGLLVASVGVAAPDCSYHYRISNRSTDSIDNVVTFAPGALAAIDNHNNGCVAWSFQYSAEGFSALSIQLESANATQYIQTPGTFGVFAGTTVTGSNPLTSTSNGTYNATGYYPWIRVNATTTTGTGSIEVTLNGWKSPAYLSSIGGQTLSNFLAPYVNNIPSVDGTVALTSPFGAGNSSAQAWSSTTSYTPGIIVTYSGTTYVAIYNSLNQTPAAGSSYWEVPQNQSPSCETQLDLAFYTQHGIALQTNTSPSLNFGSNGVYGTCLGLNEGSQLYGIVGLRGQGDDWAGGSGRKPITTIKAQGTGWTANEYLLYHGDISGGSGGAANLHIYDISLDPNAVASCYFLAAMEAANIFGISCQNYAATASAPASFGDISNPGGYYSAFSDSMVRHFAVSGANNSVRANQASVTLSGSTATPTLNSGGTYTFIPGTYQYQLSDTCTTTQPVYNITASGTGPYAVSAITQPTAGAGCPSPLYLVIPDVPGNAVAVAGLEIAAVDSNFDDGRISGAGFKECVYMAGADTSFNNSHIIGCPLSILDNSSSGGNSYINNVFDSSYLYGFAAKSSSILIGNKFEWNSTTAFVGARAVQAFSGATYLNVTNSMCVEPSYQGAAGYQFFTYDPTASAIPLSTMNIQNNQTCGSSTPTPFTNYVSPSTISSLTGGAVTSTVASATTIAPTTPFVFVTGTTAIATMTPTSNCTTSGIDCEITLIADPATGPYTITTAGNFYATLTATIGQGARFVYHPANSKWYQVH